MNNHRNDYMSSETQLTQKLGKVNPLPEGEQNSERGTDIIFQTSSEVKLLNKEEKTTSAVLINSPRQFDQYNSACDQENGVKYTPEHYQLNQELSEELAEKILSLDGDLDQTIMTEK